MAELALRDRLQNGVDGTVDTPEGDEASVPEVLREVCRGTLTLLDDFEGLASGATVDRLEVVAQHVLNLANAVAESAEGVAGIVAKEREEANKLPELDRALWDVVKTHGRMAEGPEDSDGWPTFLDTLLRVHPPVEGFVKRNGVWVDAVAEAQKAAGFTLPTGWPAQVG